VIVILILGIWIFPRIAASGKSTTAAVDTAWMSAAAKLKRQSSKAESKTREENIDVLTYDKPDNSNSDKARLFPFDPNTLSIEGWEKLGIRQKTAVTIRKYLSKGGHFYQAADLKKIYGIHPADYERLQPYVKIETPSGEAITTHSNDVRRSANTPAYQPIDINSADTFAFISLPGIGSKLASRIVNFRDKLGGFYSIDQVSETYGLADSTFQKIRPLLVLENVSIKKMNVNTATKDDMKSHPYLRWNLANAIVEYRNQHGNFSSLEELKMISAITDEVFNRIKFYLVTE